MTTDVTVLRCTGVTAETAVPYSGLSELLEPVRDRWPDAPALRQALGHEPGEPRALAVYTAVTAALRALRPVLVLVDRVRDVDPATVAALRFAERRVPGEPIGIVLNGEDEDRPAPADEALADALEFRAAEAAAREGMAATVSVLRHAARLSTDEHARARRLTAAAHAAWKTGDPELARRLLDTVAAVVREPVARPLTGRLRGLIELYSGDQAAAQEHLTAMAADVDPDQAARLLFLAIDAAHHRDRHEDVVALATRIGELPGEPGFRELARLLAREFSGSGPAPEPWRILDAVPETLTEQHAHRWLVPMAISRRGPHRRATREFGLVAADRLRAHGVLALRAVLLPWLADVEIALGHWADAHAHASEAARTAEAMGQRATLADARACLARIAALRGDAAECQEHARFVLREAPAQHNLLAAAHARWALGLLHLSRGEHETAAERLTSLGHRDVTAAARADLADAQGVHFGLSDVDSPFERARAALRKGQRLRRERRITAAKTELREALETFESLGAAEWARLASGELRATGAVAAPTAGLTAQERQVAELAAAGLSNREIGARLFLSPRTVGYHLYKLFPKLGIASRAQLRDVALSG